MVQPCKERIRIIVLHSTVSVVRSTTYSSEFKTCDRQLPFPLARARRNRYGKILVGLQVVRIRIWILRVVGAVVENRPELLIRWWANGVVECGA